MTFEEHVRRALDSLPPELARRLENVAVVVEDENPQDPDLFGLFQEQEYLPAKIAWRRKAMFRAPLHSFFSRDVPDFVDQLLSEAALRKTGWFNVERVQSWRARMQAGRLGIRQRTIVELGMVGVLTSQLWYHTFIDSTLADLPGWRPPPTAIM